MPNADLYSDKDQDADQGCYLYADPPSNEEEPGYNADQDQHAQDLASDQHASRDLEVKSGSAIMIPAAGLLLCSSLLAESAGVAERASSSCVRPPSSMVAWWPFDETRGTVVHDIAGGNNGTPKTGPVGSGGPMPGAGKVAGALHFNGTSASVQVRNTPNLNFGTGSLSIDAWIKIPPPGIGFMPIVDKEIPGPTDATYGYVFYVKDGHLGFDMSAIDAPPHGFIGAQDRTTALADNLWHHVGVAVQRNPASATGGTLFINGATIATFSTTPFFNLTADNPGALVLGSTNRLSRLPVSAFFKGWIDEVEIFNRALDPTEIKSIYNAGPAGKCKSLLVSGDPRDRYSR